MSDKGHGFVRARLYRLQQRSINVVRLGNPVGLRAVELWAVGPDRAQMRPPPGALVGEPVIR